MLIFIVVVLVLLVAADRIGVVVAQRKVADKVRSSQDLSSTPSVTIEGFPFLTQVIGNHYQAVRLTANGLIVGTGADRLRLNSLTARLTGVRATGNYSGVTADSITATATAGYAELSRVVGVPLSYGGLDSAGTGRVQARQTATVLGQAFSAIVTATVGVSDGQMLTFDNVKVTLDGAGVDVPQSVTDRFTAIFAKRLALTGLPFGLRVRSVSAGASGVAVTATAAKVALG